MSRIKKNDIVYVMSGKDKGKSGRVLKTFNKNNRVIVEGINMCKRHLKQTKQDRPGGIIEKENPIHVSNVTLYCSKCKKGVKIGYKFLEDRSKIRICKKCKEVI